MRFSITMIMILILSSLLQAKLSDSPENIDNTLFQCTSVGENSTAVSFVLGSYQLEAVTRDNRSFQKLSSPGAGESSPIGKPELPVFTRLISIPNRGEVSFRINSLEDEQIENLVIYPFQPPQSESVTGLQQLSIDEEFYRNGTTFPAEIVRIGTPAIMRDRRVVAITINPFQYDPLSRSLRVINNIEITFATSGVGGTNILSSDNTQSRLFESTYRSELLNYRQQDSRDEIFQQPCYLFIYPDNETVLTNLEPLIQWKQRKGYEVHLASTAETGSSSSSIKSYIQDAYDNWANPPEFICLVGDAEGNYSLATSSVDGGEGDHYYVLLAGDDILADAFIGRLSFDSITELQTIVAKILNYEREPWTGQTGWYDRALMVGDPGSSGPSVIDTKRQCAAMIEENAPNIVCEEIYSGSWTYHISNNINSGVSYFNYRGFYGMSGWTNYHINELNNGFMMPVAVFLTCGVGSYASNFDEARSEIFLRVGTPTLPQGAVATIATATTMTHTCYNNCVDMGIFDGIFVDGIYHLGGALNSGKLSLYLSYPQNPANSVYRFSYWNNLMGDPGMEIWTGVPQDLLVSYNSQLPVGSRFLQVLVEDDQDTPLPNAWVTITRDDGELFASGLTDQNGTIALAVEATVELLGEAHLTVTRHNFRPHLGSVSVVEEELFVNISDSVIDDDNNGDSSGNDDGLINPGEQIELGVALYNHGSIIAIGVSAELSSGSDFVTISDNSEEYDDIPPGTELFSGDDFDFTVAGDVVGGEEIRFNLLVNDDTGHQWHDIQYHYIVAPNLYPGTVELLDDDGILDPGETVQLTVQLHNGGTVDADAVSATLISHHSRITIEDDGGFYGNIPAGSNAENNSDTFSLRASILTLPGTQAPMELQITTPAGYDQSVTFLLEVGQVTQSDPLGPDDHGYCCYDDSDTGYIDLPVYNWIEIDPTYGGSGNELSLYDNGNTGDVDFVNLPFDLVFYGEAYDELTVCSNGWISPGHTDNHSFMNWYIPGPGGPSPMIAPFWDDLEIASGGVYYYHDQGQHYTVIEWSHLQNDYGSHEETFQAILYDPLYYPTSTGDSRILFQYQTVNNVDVGSYSGGYVSHGQYATVGIEDHTGAVGLEYTFNNSYPAAAKPLEDEMAILFTGYPLLHNDPYLVQGEITVSDSDGNGVIEYGEQVELDIALANIGLEEATGISGELTCSDTLITFVNSTSNYNAIPTEESGVNLTPFSFDVSRFVPDDHVIPLLLTVTTSQESWEFNIFLRAFAPVVEQTSLIVNDDENGVLNPGETADVLISYHNQGGADVSNAFLELTSDDEYLIINSASWEFDALLSGETNTAVFNLSVAEETPAEHIIALYWNLDADLDYTVAGEIALPVSQVAVWLGEDFNEWLPAGWSVTSSTGVVNWFGSDSDGAGGGAPEARFAWTFQTIALQRLISPPVNTHGHADLELEFKHAITHESGPIEISVQTTSDGTNWQTVHSWPAADLNARTENLVISNSDVGSDNFQVAWVINGDSYHISNWYVDEVRLGSQGYGFIGGVVTLDGGDGLVEDVQVATGEHFTHPDADGEYLLLVPVGTYDLTASLEEYASVTVENVSVDLNETVSVDFILQPGDGVDDEQLPLTTGLTGNYPNPFNPTTTIAFSLAGQVADVEIAIFNVTGQKINTLVKGTLPVGNHTIIWNSDNYSSQQVASGIYFYQLHVDSKLISTRRMLLIR
jgi:hypothetical protein